MDEVLDSPSLSPAQLAVLGEIGEERRAQAGEVLYRVGDRDFPFVVILEGDVAVLDAVGREIARHGASQFLGELNLLSGQSLLVSAVADTPLRYLAVERGLQRETAPYTRGQKEGGYSYFAARRFLANGRRDKGFGDGGVFATNPTGSQSYARSAVTEGNGQVVAGGWIQIERGGGNGPGNTAMLLTRYR